MRLSTASLGAAEIQSFPGGKHAGSLEALRVARPKAVDLEGIKTGHVNYQPRQVADTHAMVFGVFPQPDEDAIIEHPFRIGRKCFLQACHSLATARPCKGGSRPRSIAAWCSRASTHGWATSRPPSERPGPYHPRRRFHPVAARRQPGPQRRRRPRDGSRRVDRVPHRPHPGLHDARECHPGSPGDEMTSLRAGRYARKRYLIV